MQIFSDDCRAYKILVFKNVTLAMKISLKRAGVELMNPFVDGELDGSVVFHTLLPTLKDTESEDQDIGTYPGSQNKNDVSLYHIILYYRNFVRSFEARISFFCMHKQIFASTWSKVQYFYSF